MTALYVALLALALCIVGCAWAVAWVRVNRDRLDRAERIEVAKLRDELERVDREMKGFFARSAMGRR